MDKKRAFGEVRARSYSESISLAVQALKDGPEIVESKLRDEIELAIRTLHVACLGHKGRHLVIFRVGCDRTIDVLRLLHDSIDHPKIYRLRMTFYVDSGRSFQRLQPPVSTLTVSVPPSI